MRRPRAFSISALLASCLVASVCTQPVARAVPTPIDVSFPTKTDLSTEQPYGSSVIVADFDGDGRPDVAAASVQDSQISWYRNLGNGSFSSANIISTAALGACSIVAADIDADGRLDIVSASQLDNRIAWFRNVGGAPAGLFAYNPNNRGSNLRTISTSARFALSVAVADVNGDGLWDVVSASFFDNKIAYYKNLGGGNFGWTPSNPTANQHVISTAGDSPSCLAAGDLDGDGIADLAVTSINDNTLAWFRGGFDDNGNPTFTRYVLSTDLPNALSVSIADMNKDRRPDLLVASPSFGNKISYFKNTSQLPGSAAPFFAPEQIVATEARGVASVIASDINRDGNPDIVCALLLDNRVLWYPGNGVDENGEVTFGAERLVSAGTDGPTAVAAGDFDGDGVMDVTSTSQVDSTVAVFLNAGEFDGDVTLAPTLIAPAAGTVTTTPVKIAYTLPEDALPGSVTVSFVSGATVRELILATDGESAGPHSFSFDPANPGASSSVQSGSPSIQDGTYTVSVSYQDAAGNPAVASAPATGVVIDAEAPFLPGASTKVLAVKGGIVPGAGVQGSGIPAEARLRVLGVPAINDASHLAFTATYSAGATVRQVVLGPDASGETAVLAGVGDAVPNAAGAPQSQLAFLNFSDALLNESDATAFIATIRGVGAAAASVSVRNDRGIWTNAGNGHLRQVVREFDVAAGLPVRYAAFTSVALSANFVRQDETVERTNIAFTGKLIGTGVVAANDEALWNAEVLATGEISTRLLLRKGQDVSLRGVGRKRIKTLVALAPLDGAAGHGRGAIPTGVAARLEFTDTTQAIVRVGSDGVIRDVAMTGDDLAEAGARVLRFGLPVQNTRGDTVTIASLNTRSNDTAVVFAPDEAAFSLAVREGEPADGIESSAFTGFKIAVTNEEQNIAFLGRATGRGVTAYNDDGLWYLGQSSATFASSGPVLIAREGAQAAGVPAGGRWSAFRSIALPDGANGPVFLADLTIPAAGAVNPARISATNDSGVWAVDSNGVLRLIVREGDVFPGTALTIRALALLGNVAGSPAQTRSFNGDGEIVYRATLSDGSEAIAKARVP